MHIITEVEHTQKSSRQQIRSKHILCIDGVIFSLCLCILIFFSFFSFHKKYQKGSVCNVNNSSIHHWHLTKSTKFPMMGSELRRKTILKEIFFMLPFYELVSRFVFFVCLGIMYLSLLFWSFLRRKSFFSVSLLFHLI